VLASLTPAEKSILILLAAVWGIAYVGGMWRGTPNADRSRRLARPARLVMIGVVLAVGLIWLRHAPGTDAARYGWLIMGGLIAGALGDLLLGGIVPIRHAEMVGMGVFGVGHLLYFGAIFDARARLGLSGGLSVLVAALSGAAVVAALWWFAIRERERGTALNAGSLIYGVLLGAVTAAAIATWLASGRLATLAVGLILFLISDVMLARYLVRRRGFPSVRDVVWLVYSAGQVLIACSIGAAVAVFG
jgi:uncharacterized membrane protein YhhN